jgi:enamine deaminase RidA (YjgF/YER057c/UK114 family)
LIFHILHLIKHNKIKILTFWQQYKYIYLQILNFLYIDFFYIKNMEFCAMTVKDKMLELNIELPKVSAPAANYVPYTVIGNLVFISGTLPVLGGEFQGVGKVGENISIEDAIKTARCCGLNILAHLTNACGGDLERVKKCVKLGIFVNAVGSFTEHPKVANGVSDLMVEIFGKEIGSHARFAVGSSGLPFGVSVEVEAIFELK